MKNLYYPKHILFILRFWQISELKVYKYEFINSSLISFCTEKKFIFSYCKKYFKSFYLLFFTSFFFIIFILWLYFSIIQTCGKKLSNTTNYDKSTTYSKSVKFTKNILMPIIIYLVAWPNKFTFSFSTVPVA